MSTYGADTMPVTEIVRPSLAAPLTSGAAIRSAVRNCDETLASSVTRPPVIPRVTTVSGRCPSASSCVTVTPSVRKASTIGPTGRRRICGDASKRNVPWPVAASAGRNRAAVPASRQ